MDDGMMDRGMARVIESFPEHAAAILDRFHADQSFREICGDYAETRDALERWQASSSPQRMARIEEYRELARALEIEIVAALGLPAQDTKDDLT
jgi:hypothetical protein